jgi:hypothetical protein
MNSCEVNPISAHYGLLQPCESTVSGSVCGLKGQTQKVFHGTAERCLHNSTYLVLNFYLKNYWEHGRLYFFRSVVILLSFYKIKSIRKGKNSPV